MPDDTELEGYFTAPEQMSTLLECWIPEVELWLSEEYAGTTPAPAPNGYVFIPPGAENEDDRSSGCTFDDQDMFYCPQDGRIYLGASAIWELYSEQGDLVPVLVIAHETGHYLQQYSGVSVADQEEHPTEEIPFENQSDCTAGVFLDYVNHRGGLTSGGEGVEDDIVDLAEGMQRMEDFESRGERRTHGTMDQRMRSFYTGYLGNQGLNACNVFITDFNVFPTTGVEVVPPVEEVPTVPAPAPTIEPTGLGVEAALTELAQSCYDGDMRACDTLFDTAQAVAGAEPYVSFADTCAGRQPASTGVWCRVAFISTTVIGPTTTVATGPTTTVPVGPPTTVLAGPTTTVAGTPALAPPMLDASIDDVTNHTRSSTGATLVSRGMCGGAFSLDIFSNGFERLGILVVSPAGATVLQEWFDVPQNYAARLSLPVGYQNAVYTVIGADWTTNGWETSSVTTWFERITNGDNYGTWVC